jgi:hypothetical protein
VINKTNYNHCCPSIHPSSVSKSRSFPCSSPALSLLFPSFPSFLSFSSFHALVYTDRRSRDRSRSSPGTRRIFFLLTYPHFFNTKNFQVCFGSSFEICTFEFARDTPTLLFWWDSKDHGISLGGTVGAFFFLKCQVKEEERVRGMPPTVMDKWLKKVTSDDTGLTRPPAVSHRLAP